MAPATLRSGCGCCKRTWLPAGAHPVVLFVTHEDTDKLFELLVDMFGLAVSLRKVSFGRSGFDTDEAPQFASEFSDKLWTTVRNVVSGGSVVPPNILVVQPGSSDSTKAGVALLEVGPAY
jgi:hypothetical protein